ncbi:MAG: succinyldiaminopimelate transaminase [Nocardioidaceae bacterium]|nr:succinyldiaminopimelate transaminase [Nocardioidaceae bacterium]
MSRRLVSSRLPDFPWDSLAAARARAVAHEGGLVDLSVGTPVDPTPDVVRDALAAASDSPGYPTTVGTTALRGAVLGWLERRFGVTGLDVHQVLPSIGSKELIGSLALHLGIGRGDEVVVPELAYPTYAVGAALVGADVVVSDAPDLEPVSPHQDVPALVWINSPANPHGAVMSPGRLTALVRWARENGVLLVSDECYLEFGWQDERPSSVLHPDVNGGSVEGLLAVHSLSKRSNLAGYRGAFVAGDAAVVAELLEVRKNLGLQMPAPQQAACVAALDDDAHVDEQRARYLSRRARLRPALEEAGFTIDHSEGSLYLWATRGEPCRDTVDHLADLGILVAPGDFYGAAGSQHVRVALTVTDERVDAAVARLS